MRPGYADAWLFYSLNVGEKGTLANVTAHADFVMRAIPNDEEWRGMCDRLGRKGLVEWRDGRPRYTKFGQTWLNEALKKPGGMLVKIERWERLISELPDIAEPARAPTLQEVKEAAEAWHKEARAFMAGKEKKKLRG